MQNYKYFNGGLEDMATKETKMFPKFIIVFSDGTKKSMDEATDREVSQAVSIVRIEDTSEASIKNP